MFVFKNQWDIFADAVGKIFDEIKTKPAFKNITEVIIWNSVINDKAVKIGGDIRFRWFFWICHKIWVDFINNLIKNSIISVVVAPSVVLFYNKCQLRIRKIGWEEDKKCIIFFK